MGLLLPSLAQFLSTASPPFQSSDSVLLTRIGKPFCTRDSLSLITYPLLLLFDQYSTIFVTSTPHSHSYLIGPPYPPIFGHSLASFLSSYYFISLYPLLHLSYPYPSPSPFSFGPACVPPPLATLAGLLLLHAPAEYPHPRPSLATDASTALPNPLKPRNHSPLAPRFISAKCFTTLSTSTFTSLVTTAPSYC